MKFTIDTNKWFSRNKEINPSTEVIQRGIESEYWNPIMGTLGFNSYNQYSNSKAMKLSAYYRGVEILSSSIAVLPLQPYIIKQAADDKEYWKYKDFGDLYYLLNVSPAENISAYQFKKLMVQQVINKGNCFIKINRGIAGIKSFDILEPDYISVLINDIIQTVNSPITQGTKTYYDRKTGITHDDFDIIHIMNYSTNNILGMSTISSAALTLEISYNSEQHASQFFESGSNMGGILSPVAGMNMGVEKAKNAKQAFQEATSSKNMKSGNIVVLDSGLQFQATTVSPRDSQLLESRAFNILNIAQFLGVPPSKLFDNAGSSYASAEASQIDFLNSTILSWCEKIENEVYRKLYTKIEYPFSELEFDTKKLLRLDSAAQATYFSQLYNMGAISTNEIRQELNMASPVKGGNKHFIQVNLQDINALIVDQNNSIDNKLK